MNKAVFLDRDGVIIEEPYEGYAYRPDQLKLISGTEDAIRLLNENNFKVIVVSNQAGVAKGYYLEKDVILFNQLMKEDLEKKDARIDAIYYCCHNPIANCDCRKPKPGMLKKAEKEFDIDLQKSFLIGDKNSDILAGRYVGCKTCLVLTGHGIEELKKYNIKYDLVADDLYNCVRLIFD